jgi:hypothetical protein
MWDTNTKLLRNMHPSRLPAAQRERWTLKSASWDEYSEDERRRWREWFEWATSEGGEFWDASRGCAKVVGAFLRSANLSRIRLVNAILERTNLSAADLSLADLSGADLSSAWLEHANMNRAKLIGADLSNSRLDKADFTHADLSEASIHRTDLSRVDFRDARLFSTRITEPTWWFGLPRTTIRGEVLFQQGLPEHPIQDVAGLPPVLRRQMSDLQYLRDTWRRATPTGRMLIWLWGLTCCFGQSLGRWTMISLAVAFAFALMYLSVPLNMTSHDAQHGTVITELHRPTFARALLYSISTLMSLGMGTELPVTGGGRFLVWSEAVMGYLMLGGLLSILANKFARLS